jgi:hypothetical protein
MALLQSRCSFDLLIGDPSDGADRSPMSASSPVVQESSPLASFVLANRVSNDTHNTMNDLEDAAIPHLIVLVQQHWGFDDEDHYVDNHDDDAFDTAYSSKGGEQLVPVGPKPSPRPSEATIQVVKMFFDGIEDQMDVEDELLFGRPEEVSSIVSDLSVVTTSTTDSSSSSLGG